MAITGVSSSFYAKYEKDAETELPKYSGGGAFARMTNIDFQVTSNETESYSDDSLEEADYSFASGTLKVDVTDILDGVVSDITGAKVTEIKAGEETVSEIVYDDDQEDRELGFGFVIEKKKKGVFSFRAIVLPRIKFKIPGDAVATRGKTLTFQTKSVEAVVHRDHSEKRTWKREATFATKQAAVAYIKNLLGITEAAAVAQGGEDDGNS